jgi:hypothetical protein
VREMLDAVEVGTNSRRTIMVILQIADIRVGALTQNARSEPVTIRRDKQIALLWTAERPSENIFRYAQRPEAATCLKDPSVRMIVWLHRPALHIIRE